MRSINIYLIIISHHSNPVAFEFGCNEGYGIGELLLIDFTSYIAHHFFKRLSWDTGGMLCLFSFLLEFQFFFFFLISC